MSDTDLHSPAPAPLDDPAVADYLREYPDFFVRHEALLARMHVPHARSGKAVSLVERQVMVLRDENQQLMRKLENLIDIAKRNEQLNRRIQGVILALLGAATLDELLDTLYASLSGQFHNDAVAMRLFGGAGVLVAGRPEYAEYDAQIFNLFENVLRGGQPVCGRLSEAQIEFLFPGQKIGSAVLMPLGTPEPYGILALGSADVARYASSMGTDLLTYLGDIVSQLLKSWQARMAG